ncbi:MAG: hypothetical protein R2827_00210 [Bdellovibrionales bacterium]
MSSEDIKTNYSDLRSRFDFITSGRLDSDFSYSRNNIDGKLVLATMLEPIGHNLATPINEAIRSAKKFIGDLNRNSFYAYRRELIAKAC